MVLSAEKRCLLGHLKRHLGVWPVRPLRPSFSPSIAHRLGSRTMRESTEVMLAALAGLLTVVLVSLAAIHFSKKLRGPGREGEVLLGELQQLNSKLSTTPPPEGVNGQSSKSSPPYDAICLDPSLKGPASRRRPAGPKIFRRPSTLGACFNK